MIIKRPFGDLCVVHGRDNMQEEKAADLFGISRVDCLSHEREIISPLATSEERSSPTCGMRDIPKKKERLLSPPWKRIPLTPTGGNVVNISRVRTAPPQEIPGVSKKKKKSSPASGSGSRKRPSVRAGEGERGPRDPRAGQK